MMRKAVGICVAMIAFSAGMISGAAAQGSDSDGPQACMSCHQSGGNFIRNFDMWKESGHSTAFGRIIKNDKASPDCYSCHSDEGFKAKQLGKKVDIAQKTSFSSVTCGTCHRLPHDGKYPRQLVDDPETLCTSCHTQRSVLKGIGAKGMDEVRSFHSAVDCISCHMSETNHRMKVFRPDNAEVSEKRLDTCTTCHKDNNRKARVTQLQGWQKSYQEGMDPLQADLTAINAALKKNPALLNDGMKAKLNEVSFNLSILVKDGSRGSHNIDFTADILSRSAQDILAIKTAAGLDKDK